MLNNCSTRQLNGCHSKPRPDSNTVLVVQDGYELVTVDIGGQRKTIPVPKMETRPFRHKRSCKYDLNTTDPSCKGCPHIGVDYDGVKDGAE